MTSIPTYTIAIVEDDRTTRLLLRSALGSQYQLHLFESAEELLMHEQEHARIGSKQYLPPYQPDLYLLDVGLPEMNGLELCRHLKSRPTANLTPVLFLSSHDSPEEILAGYEAGGQDYIVKPVDIASLRHKIDNLRRIQTDQRALAEQVRDADELTSQVLANLDEYAIVVKFLRALNTCTSTDGLVQACFDLLQDFDLEGVVQTRLRGQERTSSAHGENWPLEVAVIKQMRDKDRIFEHKHLACFNAPSITLLATNMPRHDQDHELRGRIRDHLAIAVETADAKLHALQDAADNHWIRSEIEHLLASINEAVETMAQQYNNARYQETVHTIEFIDELSTTFAEASMTESQEQWLLESIRQRIRQFASLYDIAPQAQQTLSGLTEQMEQILLTAAPILHQEGSAAWANAKEDDDDNDDLSAAGAPAIELF